MTRQQLGLGFGSNQVVDDDQFGSLRLGRKRVTQAERADLLGKIMLVAADDRAVGLAATTPPASSAAVTSGPTV